jgi:hypothetical protein
MHGRKIYAVKRDKIRASVLGCRVLLLSISLEVADFEGKHP